MWLGLKQHGVEFTRTKSATYSAAMAADKLKGIRTSFVDKSSKELISQLLDDLLGDQVFNDGEKDSILEENKSRADKARALIDSVCRKGDKASQKMIDHFQNRDPTLFSDLNLST